MQRRLDRSYSWHVIVVLFSWPTLMPSLSYSTWSYSTDQSLWSLRSLWRNPHHAETAGHICFSRSMSFFIRTDNMQRESKGEMLTLHPTTKNYVYAIVFLFNWPIFVLYQSYTNHRLIQLTNRRRFCSRALGAVTRTPSWFLQQILLVIEVVPLLLLTVGTFSIFKLLCHTLLY